MKTYVHIYSISNGLTFSYFVVSHVEETSVWDKNGVYFGVLFGPDGNSRAVRMPYRVYAQIPDGMKYVIPFNRVQFRIGESGGVELNN